MPTKSAYVRLWIDFKLQIFVKVQPKFGPTDHFTISLKGQCHNKNMALFQLRCCFRSKQWTANLLKFFATLVKAKRFLKCSSPFKNSLSAPLSISDGRIDTRGGAKWDKSANWFYLTTTTFWKIAVFTTGSEKYKTFSRSNIWTLRNTTYDKTPPIFFFLLTLSL